MSEKRPALRDRIRAVRGQAYLVMGHRDQVLAAFKRAIGLGAADAGALIGRGQTHQALGRYDQALEDFDRAIELDPTEDEFTAARTEICQLTGRSDTDDALPTDRGTTAT